MLEQLTMGQLLEHWRDELVRTGLAASADTVPTRPVVIEDLERRLGRPLSPSYREFFAACSGMSVTGALTQGLRPAQDVGWFRDLESDWLQTWRETADDPDDPGPDVELMSRALLISKPGDEALLLDPCEVDPASGEWACYTFSNFAPGAERVGPSFRSGLESVYRSFLAVHDVSSVTLDEYEQAIDDTYQALLAGDLAQRDQLEVLAENSWRARLLAAQFDAFGAPFRGLDTSTTIPPPTARPALSISTKLAKLPLGNRPRSWPRSFRVFQYVACCSTLARNDMPMIRPRSLMSSAEP